VTDYLRLVTGWCTADVEIMVHPGILDARNYFSWQKLFDKKQALLSRIKNNWLNSCTFCLELQFFGQIPAHLLQIMKFLSIKLNGK